MKKLIFQSLSITFFAFLIGCADANIENIEPPDIPIEQLLSSPDTAEVEGRKLHLTTDLWRDFMPIVPPGGRPLNAILFINAVDTMPLPSSITSDAVWIVNDNQIWKSWFSNETIAPDLQKPYRIVKIARNGPKWDPCSNCVSVIVRIFDSNRNVYFLLAPDQSIGSTW